MMFLLKKVIGLMCMPLTVAGLCMIAGAALMFGSRRQFLAKTLLFLGMGIALGSGWAPLADGLLAPLENRYPTLREVSQATGVRHVVVLGGGHNSDARLTHTGQLSDASLARLIEGIRLHRMLDNSLLVFTGGAVFDPVPHARVMGLAAMSLGVDERRIFMLDTAKDTAQEALDLRRTIGQRPFVLVTSAAHMPRAMLLFQAAGMNPLAAPTDYQVKKSGVTHPGDYFPSAIALRRTERAVYEYLGLIWAVAYEIRRLQQED